MLKEHHQYSRFYILKSVLLFTPSLYIEFGLKMVFEGLFDRYQYVTSSGVTRSRHRQFLHGHRKNLKSNNYH